MTEDLLAGGRRNGIASHHQVTGKKLRTPKSCERCKSRKTKCIDPVPGPCRYCAHIGAACSLASRPRQRPYYHVSEEEYRCSMQILHHFLPEEELNLQTLRSIAKGLQTGDSPLSQTTSSSDSKLLKEQDDADGIASNVSEAESEEIGDLHDKLGCLMKDSMGKYRYVGAYSDIVFNAAVCSMADPKQEANIISPPRGDYPPQKPERTKLLDDLGSSGMPYLPPIEYCHYYVARFFEEVHCIYWLYPIEQFHARLDETYVGSSGASSSSWLCSLYAICALGAAAGETPNNQLFEDFVSEEARRYPDTKTSDDYIALAKALIPAVHDEADIDSIRALATLSLALLTFKFRITAYLYMGTCMQVAFSLGLQHDQSPVTQSPVTRQQNRRIWWTLYTLDQEISSRCGSPCLSDERSLRIQTLLPSEQVLNPGPNTPLGVLPLSVSLNRLKRKIIESLYPERSSDSRKVSSSRVASYISALHKWLSTMPSHLKWGVPVAPTHRRSIGILHLNYWNAMMLLTQPFLLYLVLCGSGLSHPKKAWFERLGNICLDAAKNALLVQKTMRSEKSLSSLITLDCTCTLKIIMIMSLALAIEDKNEYREDIDSCIEILNGMEQIGFCGDVIRELPVRLIQLGVKTEDTENGTMDVPEKGSSQLWSGLHPNLYADTPGNFSGVERFGDSFDVDLFIDMDLDVSYIPGEPYRSNMDFFGGTYPGFDDQQSSQTFRY